MAAPTVRLTHRANRVLKDAGIESDAIVALRVRQAVGELAGEKWRFWLSNILSWVPLVGIAVEQLLNRLFGDSQNRAAVLVLTADDGRYLLSLEGWGRQMPVDLIHTFSHGAPLMPDRELERSVFCQVMVDGRPFIVNTVDFKFLVKMIFTGQIEAPRMKDSLDDYWKAMKWVAREEPDQVVEALSGTYKPDPTQH